MLVLLLIVSLVAAVLGAELYRTRELLYSDSDVAWYKEQLDCNDRLITNLRDTVVTQGELFDMLNDDFLKLTLVVDNYLDDLDADNLSHVYDVMDEFWERYGDTEFDDNAHDAIVDKVEAEYKELYCSDSKPEIKLYIDDQEIEHHAQDAQYDAHCECLECPPECEYCQIAEQTKMEA